MYKQYILLRDNKKSGPYNHDDLLQLNIKPFDLLWVQDKSTSWQTADTISELNNILKPKDNYAITSTFTSSVSSNRIYIQLPLNINLAIAEEQEVSADVQELKQPALNHPTDVHFHELSMENQAEVYRYRSLEEIKNEYELWCDQQKPAHNKTKTKFSLAGICSLIASPVFLFFKQLKHLSGIQSQVALQPVNDVKDVV